jgi:hypothetical protein
MRNKLAGFFGKLRASRATFGPAADRSGSIMLAETTTACSYFHACHFAANFPCRDVGDTRNEQADGFFIRHQHGRSFNLVCAMSYKNERAKNVGKNCKPFDFIRVFITCTRQNGKFVARVMSPDALTGRLASWHSATGQTNRRMEPEPIRRRTQRAV